MIEVPIVVLISEPNGSYTIERIPATLEAFQKAVGDGYIEAVTVPNKNAMIYLDEEGKMKGRKPNPLSTLYLDRLRPGFASHDVLVGNIIWMGAASASGREQSIPIEHVLGFTGFVLNTIADPIVVVRYGDDIWVYDTPEAGPLLDIKYLWRVTAPADDWKHKIEVAPGMSKGTWQEMRVEIMDRPNINLHDERVDKSYG